MKKDLPAKRGTKDEIARWLDVSERTITDYIGRLGLKPDSREKYAVLSCYQEQQRRMANDPKNQTVAEGDEPPIRSWADVEKRERVLKLRIEIQSLRDELVPQDEVRDTLAELCAAVKGALGNFVEHVAAGKRDAEILKWAESARDAALAGIAEGLHAD